MRPRAAEAPTAALRQQSVVTLFNLRPASKLEPVMTRCNQHAEREGDVLLLLTPGFVLGGAVQAGPECKS